MKISIIKVKHNYANKLKYKLNSTKSQDYKDIERIIIDGGL